MEAPRGYNRGRPHKVLQGLRHGRTVTINKPRQELYTFWRDFSDLPVFMEKHQAGD
jgi:uncharacterized membrane protein